MIAVPLRLNLPFGAGEATLAFASRLAARNGVRLAKLFCQDVGIMFAGLVDGNPDALARLAEVTGASLADLHAGNVVRRKDGFFLGDNRLPAPFFRRQTFHVCPACLQADIAGSTFEPDAAAYGRLIWQVVPIRTCRIHGMALVDLGSGDRSSLQDFTAVIRPSLGRLDTLALGASLRPTSDLERYVAGRLEGNPVEVPFLDEVELHAAARFCEVLGACVVFGRGLRLEGLSDDDWHLAGATGITIASAGETGVRQALCELRRTNPYGYRSAAAPLPPLRQFRSWLTNASKDRAYQGLRAFVAAFVSDGGDADIEFKRRYAAERSYECSAPMFSISLIEGKYRFLTRGLIQNEATTNSMNGVEHPTGSRTTNAEMELPLVAATDHLNCDLALFSSMMARGIVRRCDAGQPGQPPMFARKDLDRLLARIESVATPVPKRGNGDYGLPYVAAKVGVAEVEIVQLILEGALGRIARLEDRRGISALRVREEEVHGQLAVRAYPGMPWIEASKHLGVEPADLPLLVELGDLKVERAEMAVSGYQAAMVSRKSLDAFKNTFIEWDAVRETLRGPFPLVRCRDEIVKVPPAIKHSGYKFRFYRRAELDEVVRINRGK